MDLLFTIAPTQFPSPMFEDAVGCGNVGASLAHQPLDIPYLDATEFGSRYEWRVPRSTLMLPAPFPRCCFPSRSPSGGSYYVISPTEIQINSGATLYIKLRKTHFYLPPMSTPLQKPLLLPGIAPHLFQSRRAHRKVKTSSSRVTDQTASSHNKQPCDISMHSDYAGTLIPISYVVHSRAHLFSARRTAEALVETQQAQIALLRTSVASLTAHAHTTTNLYHETQRQLMRAIIHLNIILTYAGAETGNERGMEGALIAARDFVQECKSFFTLTRILLFVATDPSSKQ